MNFLEFELFMIAVGLSMDTFAVGICTGLTIKKAVAKKALIIGLYFGVFQAVMPLIGYITANWFADRIIAYDHWIAFVLLCIIGGKMIKESFEKDENSDREISLKPAKMLPLAVATSIDALAVGVGLGVMRVNIWLSVACIGAVTFAFSFSGVLLGRRFGALLGRRAELAGGIILILIGVRIFVEHVFSI